MRVWQLARRLGVPSKQVVQTCQRLGLNVKSPSSYLQPILAGTIEDWMKAREITGLR